MGRLVCTLVGIGSMLWVPVAGAAALTLRDVGGGISYARLDGDGDPALVGHAFDVDLTRAGVHLVVATPPGTRLVVEELAAKFPARVAVNASFFDEEGKALGLAVDAGRNLGGGRIRRWGALVIEDGAARVEAGDAAPASAALIVQGTPRLVIAGEVPQLKPQAAPRTAVCADGSRLTLIVATGPIDTTAFARALAKPRPQGGLGCRDALNLDGGSSTQLSVRLPGLDVHVDGGWSVPNAVVVVPSGAAKSPAGGDRPAGLLLP